MSDLRLGDILDDYCVKCRRLTNHSIVSLMNSAAAKVRCRTCSFEHKYRKNKGGRKEMSAQEAFQKVLASVSGQMPESSATKKKSK